MLCEVSSDAPLQKVTEQLESARGGGRAGATEGLGSLSPDVGGTEGLDVLRPDRLADTALEALDSLVQSDFDGPIDAEGQFALEAIILPRLRPVVNILGGTFSQPPSPWEHLGAGLPLQRLMGAIPSIGRVEVPGHPGVPYAGTGFVVGSRRGRRPSIC